MAGKHKLCPYGHDIIIGECGIDDAVNAGRKHWGFHGQIPQEEYRRQLRQYVASLDARVKGVAVFLADYENNEWESFNVVPMMVAGTLEMRDWDMEAQMAAPSRTGMPIDSYVRISQWYGENPAYYAQFGVAGHNGIDFSAVTGTRVITVEAGRVSKVRRDATGYGHHVVVNHGWGESLYAHLSDIRVVEQQELSRGELLGLSGNTGNSTGPHLHFGMRVHGTGTQAMNWWIDPAVILGLKADTGTGGTVQEIIGEEAQRHVLALNSVAAFEKAGSAKGYLPASPEFDRIVNGAAYRAQVYRHPAQRDKQHIVYCRIGDWGNLSWFERAN